MDPTKAKIPKKRSGVRRDARLCGKPYMFIARSCVEEKGDMKDGSDKEETWDRGGCFFIMNHIRTPEKIVRSDLLATRCHGVESIDVFRPAEWPSTSDDNQ